MEVAPQKPWQDESLPQPRDTETPKPLTKGASKEINNQEASRKEVTDELLVAEDDLAKHAVEKRPETASRHVKKVMEAAEADDPREGRLERRHEIKDEDTVMAGEPAVPVGKVVAGIPQRQPALARFKTPDSSPETPIEKIKDESTRLAFRPLPYKQAILSGLTAGLGIASFLILVFVIWR